MSHYPLLARNFQYDRDLVVLKNPLSGRIFPYDAQAASVLIERIVTTTIFSNFL
jgi:hypothetical protein